MAEDEDKLKSLLMKVKEKSEKDGLKLNIQKIKITLWQISQSVRSVAQLCTTLCDPMDCTMPGLPLLHQLPESTQTHVHWVGDANQSSRPLSSHHPPAFDLFQHQGLFKQINSLHQVAKASVLQWIQDWFPLESTGWISLQSKGLSRVFSKHSSQKHQFFDAQLSLWSNSHVHTWLLEKPKLWLDGTLLAKSCLCFLICCLDWSQLFFQGASVF